MAEGEILEEEAVTQEEEAATQEEEGGEIQTPHMTNSRGSNPQSSKEIDENQKRSCRSGVSIAASIGSPRR